ncbi:MAG: hypothetical protein ABI425_01005 [Patescibacteria group bacterium]
MFLLERKKIYLAVLSFIFIIAGCLRLYRLDQVPAGMSWDEAAIGYNGFAVWTIHRDEWLHFLPISFQSFGDYKAPFAIYVNGLSTLLFGLNLWAVRFPFAVFAILCVVGISFLTDQLLQIFVLDQRKIGFDKSSARSVVVLITAVFAVSPWHLFFSRASFESGIALCLVVWGVNFFFLSLKARDLKRLIFVGSSALFFVLSLYTYHSAKIFTPFLLLLLFAFFKKEIFSALKTNLIGVVFGATLLLPVVYDSIWKKGATRLSQTSILGSETLNVLQKIQAVVTNYIAHFSPAFLVQGATTTLRHGDGHWGVLFSTEFLLVIGVVAVILSKRFLFKDDSLRFKALSRLAFFGLGWLLVGFIPAAIGFEIPHANRALLSYPGFLIVEAAGLLLLISQQSKEKALFFKSLLGMGILIHVLLSLSFLHDYFSIYAEDSVEAFIYGYEQAFEKVMQAEPTVDKIMFTSSYGQPYIYALFFRKTNPIIYHGGSLVKYEFPDKITVGDLMRKNALIVASPEEIDPSLADSLIVAPSGEVRFVIIQTQK